MSNKTNVICDNCLVDLWDNHRSEINKREDGTGKPLPFMHIKSASITFSTGMGFFPPIEITEKDFCGIECFREFIWKETKNQKIYLDKYNKEVNEEKF